MYETSEELDKKIGAVAEELMLLRELKARRLLAKGFEGLADSRLTLLMKVKAFAEASVSLVEKKRKVVPDHGQDLYVKASSVIFRLETIVEDIEDGL